MGTVNSLLRRKSFQINGRRNVALDFLVQSLKHYCCGGFRDLLAKGIKGSVSAHVCKRRVLLSSSSNKLVNKKQH